MILLPWRLATIIGKDPSQHMYWTVDGWKLQITTFTIHFHFHMAADNSDWGKTALASIFRPMSVICMNNMCYLPFPPLHLCWKTFFFFGQRDGRDGWERQGYGSSCDNSADKSQLFKTWSCQTDIFIFSTIPMQPFLFLSKRYLWKSFWW